MKIEKVEVIEIKYFTTKLKVVSDDGQVDLLDIDTAYNGLSVRLLDTVLNSYRLVGGALTNKVEKLTGSLASGVFILDEFGARFCKDYECDEHNCNFYIEGEDGSYKIKLGDFMIYASTHIDLLNKPTFKIVKDV